MVKEENSTTRIALLEVRRTTLMTEVEQVGAAILCWQLRIVT